METNTIKGYYGSQNTPTDIYTATKRNGDTWCVAHGGHTVNLTANPVELGVNIEELSDIDCFTVNEPITSEEELLNAIEA